MRHSRYVAAISAVLILGACAERPAPFAPVALNVPAIAPEGGPRLSGGGDLPLILSWMEPDSDGHTLRYTRYGNDGWTDPRSVVSGVDMFVNWADMPGVQPMGGDRLAAHWLQRSGEATYAYDVVFAQSSDGGQTWSEPLRPHSDGTQTEHGFVSTYPAGNGIGLVWLDGRRMANESTEDPMNTGMTLRSAVIDESGDIHDEQLVDDLVCDCCQTDVAIAESGPVAVYRDRSPAEIRDIYVARSIEGAWQEPAPLAGDGWEIPGCPVNGPAIVSLDSFTAVAWFTAAGDAPTVKLAMSGDSGATTSWQTDIASGHVDGHVGLTMIPENRVVVSWMERDTDGNVGLLVQAIGMGGYKGKKHLVTSGLSRRSVPQIGTSGDDVIVVWVESTDDGNRILSARIAVASL